jgi:hypothetical protein
MRGSEYAGRILGGGVVIGTVKFSANCSFRALVWLSLWSFFVCASDRSNVDEGSTPDDSLTEALRVFGLRKPTEPRVTLRATVALECQA